MNTPTINPSKLAQFSNIRLDDGAHNEGPRMCALEAVAWLTDEAWSDRPACVSQVIGAFMRALNDYWDDKQRQQLKPYTLRVIGTAGDGQDAARSYLALDWMLRTYTPAWLDLAGLHEDAAALRAHRQVVDEEAAESIRPIVEASRVHATVAWDAARHVARSDAWENAGDTAAAATQGNTWGAACVAARAATQGNTWGAACVAARAAAGAAARAAAWVVASVDAQVSAWDALAPTVDTLQTSSLALLDRMINPTAGA